METNKACPLISAIFVDKQSENVSKVTGPFLQRIPAYALTLLVSLLTYSFLTLHKNVSLSDLIFKKDLIKLERLLSVINTLMDNTDLDTSKHRQCSILRDTNTKHNVPIYFFFN